VASGAVRPVVDTVRPLADIAGAHRALEAGGVRGKHLVQVVFQTPNLAPNHRDSQIS